MKNRILRIAIAISTIAANAQNEVDALRYSTQNLSGTARFSAMGGAFGSLGGEFSALSSNPAGIGMYQVSEFTFTPSFNLNTTTSYYDNTHLSSYKSELFFRCIEHHNNAPANYVVLILVNLWLKRFTWF